MILREIGSTGIQVSGIGLGAMPLSIAGRPEPDQAFAVIQAYLDGGGSFIDTANVYCLDDGDLGHNERLIAQALQRLGRSQDVVVASKGGLRRPKGDWVVDASPGWLRTSCEQSLKALGRQCIELYQLHAVDTRVGLLASLETLVELRKEGKIRHIGLSNVTLAQLRQALALTPIASVQNRCNPFERDDLDNGLLDFCAEHAISYIPHSPVGGHHGHVRLQRCEPLKRLAAKYQASPYQLVLAWFLAMGGHVLPIPGASRVASIRDSLAATELALEPGDIELIDRLPAAA
ncbi:aldo/keto reductase [Methyloterricola oryzae]|uniref:aldo/keto reductase n=1 Tax=Methyloterricola oryzae TaxID=1495050 RepID=UPI0005EB8BD4|nr:aldo/keto reductase [Methyloterricola oryzae]